MQFCAVEQHKRPRQIQLILLQRPLLLSIAGIVRVTSLTFRHWQLGRRQASLYLREHGLLLPSLDSIQDADPKSRAVSFSIHVRVDDDASNDKVVLSRDADKERNDRAHRLLPPAELVGAMRRTESTERHSTRRRMLCP